jgi:chromatin remodeling complex protein RSC6
MSEVENNEEVAVDAEALNVGNIDSFIDAIAQQNFNRAKEHFDNVLGDKMNDALEAERLSVADTIFNDAPEEPEMALDDADDALSEYEFDDDETVEVEVVDEEDDVVVDEVDED